MESPEIHSTPSLEKSAKGMLPWSVRDTWIAVALSFLVTLGLLFLTLRFPLTKMAETYGLAVLESAYLLPTAFILIWRRANWRLLGFRSFQWSALGLGCGLALGAYAIIFLHNLILFALGVDTQGDMMMHLFELLRSPLWFFFVGIVLAPVVEETFFRGVLFQGFRQRYGWLTAALLSSAIFAISHLDPASLIPTFMLGFVLAITYHRSNSLWPGMILHFLVNAWGLCAAFVATRLPEWL